MFFGAEVVVCCLIGSLFCGSVGAILRAPPPAPSETMRDKRLQLEAKKRGIDVMNSFNFAIVGISGAGKSSLRNRILGIQNDKDPQAAPVGFRETTMVPSSATHPQSKYVKVWDLPGAGTRRHPAKTYYEDKALYAYDCLILVCASRFTETDCLLAKKAKDNGVPFFFVRNKVKQDIKGCMDSDPRSTGKSFKQVADLVCSELRQELYTDINNLGIFAKNIYCIDTSDLRNPHLDGEILMKDVGRAMASYRGLGLIDAHWER